ncbi:MAG: GcrA family cell cycle regulator [Pseudomonadota bacterium]
MTWTDERVETLKRMWTEGKSASQIAKELGGVTRNAVIGKVHRLGLSNRTASTKTPGKEDVNEPVDPKTVEPVVEKAAAEVPPPTETPRTIATKEAPSRPKPIVVAGQPLPPQPSNSEISEETRASLAELEKKARRLTLMQLTERTCKWPIGDPATEDFWFCGLPCKPGKPYCETHVSVAFQPMSSRRDRKTASR